MEWLNPAQNPHLLGHRAAEESLFEAHKNGRLGQAWIFYGPKGIGKATLAYRLARFLLSQHTAAGNNDSLLFAPPPVAAVGLEVKPDHRAFRLVANNSHPDLFVIPRTGEEVKSEIGIDQVRDCIQFLRSTPQEGGWRIVIVDGADTLTRAAANALLKILEEPPKQSLLILTSITLGRLLPTIRSRCRKLALQRLGDQDLTRLMELMKVEAAYKPLLPLAQGSPGFLAQLLAEEEVEKFTNLITAAADPLQRQELAEILGAKDNAGTHELARHILLTQISDQLRQLARQGKKDMTGLERWQVLKEWFAESEALGYDRKQSWLQAFQKLAA
ncbi:MAG: DNA polymerase III subunit delta' [Dongiaceae bacterium]